MTAANSANVSVSPIDRALRIPEVVERLGVSRSFVYLELSRGRLKGRKLGGRTVVLESDLSAYLDALPAATFKRSEVA